MIQESVENRMSPRDLTEITNLFLSGKSQKIQHPTKGEIVKCTWLLKNQGAWPLLLKSQKISFLPLELGRKKTFYDTIWKYLERSLQKPIFPFYLVLHFFCNIFYLFLSISIHFSLSQTTVLHFSPFQTSCLSQLCLFAFILRVAWFYSIDYEKSGCVH